MPRLKVRESEMDIRRFRALINGKQAIVGATAQDVADYMGISLSWYYAKMRKPGKLTRDEMRKIFVYLNFTQEERLQSL